MGRRNWEYLLSADPAYPCRASSIEGLVQQVAVSYLRQGYTNFITGRIPERSDVEKIDKSIITRYGLNKDWRYRAGLKAIDVANVEYIRFERFYVILATKGEHLFYEREGERVRSCVRNPHRAEKYPFSSILVPANLTPRSLGRGKLWQDKIQSEKVFQGYSIARVRGCFKRKSKADREAYRQAVSDWQRRTANGEKLPKPRPGHGERDQRFRSVVELEKRTEKRLRDAFVSIALKRSRAQLEYELERSGFVPYSEVKNQLVRILKAINAKRRTAGGKTQELSLNAVLELKRWQVSPFEELDLSEPLFAAKYPSLADYRTMS